MRLYVVLLTIFLLALLGAAALSDAQAQVTEATPTAGEEPVVGDGGLTAVNPLSRMPVTLEPVSLSAAAAANECAAATLLSLTPPNTPDSGQTNVVNFTTDGNDPILSCIWGSNPASSRGFRTAWYQFKPNYNGQVTISTRTSGYDTILGVFTGTCGAANLTLMACSDDATGLSSEVTVTVRRGVTYFVEVADWRVGALSSPLWLNFIAAYNMPMDAQNQLVSNWQIAGTFPTPVSRHATAVVGSDIYVLGGLLSGSVLSQSFARYQTASNTWTTLNPIPGTGLANTTAVYLPATQKIYVPGGSASAVDTAGAYTNEHWSYTVPNGPWQQMAAVPQAFAYATAVASDDRYYVLGGIEGPGWPLGSVVTTTNTIRDDVLFYQPASNSWSTAAPLNTPRYGHTAAAVGGLICVAGGLTWNSGAAVGVLPVTNGECASRTSPTIWVNTGDMQFPRYFAHSAVGSDGRWYVYGGVNVNAVSGLSAPVPEVEVYDPATNSWYLLGYLYDLNGRQPGDPPLIWPRGGAIGNTIWTIGGSIDFSGNSPYPTIKKMTIPPQGDLYLPFIASGSPENFAFATASYLPLAQVRSQNIASAANRYRFYQIHLPQTLSILVDLAVPSGEDLDLYLYDDNKVIWGFSDEPFQGVSERICLTNLPAGTYYIMAQHVIPNVPDSGKNFQVAAWPVASCP